MEETKTKSYEDQERESQGQCDFQLLHFQVYFGLYEIGNEYSQ